MHDIGTLNGYGKWYEFDDEGVLVISPHYKIKICVYDDQYMIGMYDTRINVTNDGNNTKIEFATKINEIENTYCKKIDRIKLVALSDNEEFPLIIKICKLDNPENIFPNKTYNLYYDIILNNHYRHRKDSNGYDE